MTVEETVTDDMEKLIGVLPAAAAQRLLSHPGLSELIEVVVDLGRPIEARFPGRIEVIDEEPATMEAIKQITDQIGDFDRDNRAGIERTLHRISAIRNRLNEVVGLTLRVGRAVYGTIDIIRDIIESGKNILLLGPPGIGKTTKLREAARVLASDFERRVVIVDTNNEIAGDGDIPHPSIGRARRMQVPNGHRQHDVMIQAVENHMPEVVVIDEIGTEEEAAAAHTIAERGVQLIATAHGTTLENLMANPTLVDIVGGIQSVTLGDEEAKRRGTQKVVLEREAPPTFDVAVELQDLNQVAIYHDVAECVDRILKGNTFRPEVREKDESGEVQTIAKSDIKPRRRGDTRPKTTAEKVEADQGPGLQGLFSRGLNRANIQKAIRELRAPARIVSSPEEADGILVLQSRADELEDWRANGRDFQTVERNSYSQIYEALREMFPDSRGQSAEEFALREVREAMKRALVTDKAIELTPQNAYVRRLQHELANKHNFRSVSVGQEPRRRVTISAE
ncbi:MAG: R3H domain-containing nucleic acid-binding protein [Armatimonadota bacterium]